MKILKKLKLKNLIIGTLVVLFVIGVILFLYSYLTEFTGEDGAKTSLSKSVYFFDYHFFRLSSYDLDNFPIISSLLGSIKFGIILSSITGILLIDFYVWHLIKQRGYFSKNN